MSRRLGRPLALVVLLLLPVSLLSPAVALTDRWAAWDPVTGTSTNYATTMRQQAPGFPAAAVASDSRAPVQLPPGATTFLGTGTPPGAKYGSSINQSYIVLRARADNATSPSVTTYTFAQPTPDTGWAFVLGDIDADRVQVTATDENGDPVSPSVIDSWFQGTFNHAGALDLPSWDAATATLDGNPNAVDTNGASGWFEPDLRLSSLTFTYTRRSGFPVYQTWFVSRARPIGGTVTDSSPGGECPVTDSVLTLVSPYGEELGTTSPAADGTYDFGEFATQDGYTVRLSEPDDPCAVQGDAELPVSTRGQDGDAASRADFIIEVATQPSPSPTDGPTDGPTDEPGAEPTDTATAAPTQDPDAGDEPPPAHGGVLPEVGGPRLGWAVLGTCLLVTGLGLLVGLRRRA